jgi:hypothetical protein
MVQVIRGIVLKEDCEVGLTQKIEQTGLGLSTIISIVQIVFIFIIITAAGIRVHGIPDKFNIALEIRIASIVFALVAITSVIVIIKVGQPGAATIPLLAYFPCCFLGAVISPYLLYHHEIKKPEIILPSMEEFKILLTDKEFITEFQAFAADEFSVENVLAWSEIKLFEEYCLTNNARTIELGERICNQYVRPEAPYQTNLEQRIMDNILAIVDSGDFTLERSRQLIGLFDEMKVSLVKTMFDDTYQRFFRKQQKQNMGTVRINPYPVRVASTDSGAGVGV